MKDYKRLNKDMVYETPKSGKIKIIIFLVALAAVVAGVIIVATYCGKQQKIDTWKKNAVTSPKAGSLQAAGDITISWNLANEIGKVKEYKVYINDELVSTTDASTATCEYHGVKVQQYEVYVEANMRDGSTINSNIFIFYINKKGLCVNKDMAQNIEAPEWGASWYYNWDLSPFKYTSFQSLQYVPMMWKSSETDDMTINRFPKQGYKYVLAFNEPDMAQQSNITVNDGVEGMKAFMNKDIKVGSPATALCPPWSKEWFQPFMKKMKKQNMDVDFIAFHHYWNWFNDEGVQAFLKLIDDTYEMYHKPIWITEFAISGDPGNNEEQLQAVEGYMKGVIPELDKRDYVERYAWFSFSPSDFKNGASSLMQYYKGDITDLGYLYQKLGMPEGYGDDNVKCNIENPKKDKR